VTLDVDRAAVTALNRICAYFTMFPLRFPYRLLQRHASPGDLVLDPFCGRGTTNYAARLLGLDNVGLDSSPVAVAIAAAKTVAVTPERVLEAYDALLAATPGVPTPQGEFWRWCFTPRVLDVLARLRAALLTQCTSPEQVALRAIVLGALHGPRNKGAASHCSNQSPRTYAPKPAYAVRFWQQRDLMPPDVDVREVIRVRAERYYARERTPARGRVLLADSRTLGAQHLPRPTEWVVCSPPYYGLRTYLPDQWLRLWFLGGPSTPEYSARGQLDHGSPQRFAGELRTVWRAAAAVAAPGARLCVRFGGINDRKISPRAIIRDSLRDSGWRIQTVHGAASALRGKRQADHFRAGRATPVDEFDLWAIRSGAVSAP
jgi:hypothetical protein